MRELTAGIVYYVDWLRMLRKRARENPSIHIPFSIAAANHFDKFMIAPNSVDNGYLIHTKEIIVSSESYFNEIRRIRADYLYCVYESEDKSLITIKVGYKGEKLGEEDYTYGIGQYISKTWERCKRVFKR